MTTSTTIITPIQLLNQLKGLITTITQQVAKMNAATPAIATFTALQPVGVKGWVKQINNIIKQINNILRIVAMIEVIINEILALPAEAVAIVITDLVQNINALEKELLPCIRLKLNINIPSLPNLNIDKIQIAQLQIAQIQLNLQQMQSLLTNFC